MDPAPPLRDIRCFVTVAEQLGFSRAATALGLSQPAVSQAVSRLERTLGLRLLERTSREVRLTDEGTALLPLAEALLDSAGRFTTEATRLATVAHRPLRLAYCPLVGGLVAQVARRLRARAPGLSMELRPAGWTTAAEELSRGTSAAAVTSSPFPPGLTVTARFTVGISHLAVPRADPLAGRNRVRWDDVPGERELVLPGNRPAGSVWARIAARARVGGVTGPDGDDLTAGLDLVAAGAGVMPTPRLLVESVRRTDLAFVPLDAPGLALVYGLVWSPERATDALLTLVGTVHEVLRIAGPHTPVPRAVPARVPSR